MNLLMLFGGLGLFLYGMKIMGDGLELAAGSSLRHLLEKLTRNKYLGAVIGIIVTGIIQSSSATTVMVVGFVNARLMDLSQAAGVIMGANIGTTVTSLLIALKVDLISPIAIFIGVAMIMFVRKNRTKHIGQIITGLGILFLGMTTMSTAMSPLRDVEWFRNLMVMFQNNPIMGVLTGMVLTAIIQSSSASIGILQAVASQGLIGLGGSAYILYGQNIGTCITALLASIGTNKTAKRASVIHLLFNLLGTGIFLAITILFHDAFIGIFESMFPIDKASLAGLSAEQLALPQYASIAANNSRMALAQISALHMTFNIASTCILLPISGVLVKLSKLIIPGEDKIREKMGLTYLDTRILNTPPIAVAQVIKEVERMADISRVNFDLTLQAILERDKTRSEEYCRDIYENEKVVNYLNHSITEYLVKINALDLPDKDAKVTGVLFHVINDIERVSDHCENLAEIGEALRAEDLRLSDHACEELRHIHREVGCVIDAAYRAFRDRISDINILGKITDMEENIDDLTKELRNHHIDRLNKGNCESIKGVLFVDALGNFERISDHAANIAYAYSDEA